MDESSSGGVTAVIRQWQLADRLRRLREGAGLTIEQAADQLHTGAGKWSKSKLSRVERREQIAKPQEIAQLLDLYGVANEAMRSELLDLAAKSTERGWWMAYRRDLPGHAHSFVSLESSMVALREFATALVPGLLQTPDYARALVKGIRPNLAAAQVEGRVAARMARQQVLVQETPPQLHVILGQGVLEQQIGPAAVMRAQLRRLSEMTESPNVTIQVLPRLPEAHPGVEGPFSILSLPDPVPDVGYTEGPGGNLYIEDREHVRDLTLRFGSLTQLALPDDESVNLLVETARRYEHPT